MRPENMDELDRCLSIVINQMVAEGSLSLYFQDLPASQVDKHWTDFIARLAAKDIPYTPVPPVQRSEADDNLSQMDSSFPKTTEGRRATASLIPHPSNFSRDDLKRAWQDLQSRLAAKSSSATTGNQRLEAEPMINVTIDDMDKLLSRGIHSMINQSYLNDDVNANADNNDPDSSAPSEEEINLLWQELQDRVAEKVKKASLRPDGPPALDEVTEARMDQLLTREIRSLVDDAGLIPSLPDLTAQDMNKALADFARRLDKRNIPVPENWPVAKENPRRSPLNKLLTVIAAALILALALGAIGSFMPQEITAWQKKFRALITGRSESSIVVKEVKPLDPGIYEMGSYEEVNQYVPFVPIYPYDKLPSGYEEKMLKLEKTVEGEFIIEWIFAKEDETFIQIRQRDMDKAAWSMMLNEQQEPQKLDLGNGKTCIVQKHDSNTLYSLNEGKVTITTNLVDSPDIINLLKQLAF